MDTILVAEARCRYRTRHAVVSVQVQTCRADTYRLYDTQQVQVFVNDVSFSSTGAGIGASLLPTTLLSVAGYAYDTGTARLSTYEDDNIHLIDPHHNTQSGMGCLLTQGFQNVT